MNEQQARELLERYRNGLCSDEESKTVDAWVEQEILLNTWEITSAGKVFFGQSLKNKIDGIIHAEESVANKRLPLVFSKKTSFKWAPLAIAASILLFLATGGYFVISNHSQKEQLSATRYKYIAPGAFKATLTLSGGQQIVLNDAKNGTLAIQANTTIHKAGQGLVDYAVKPNVSPASGALVYNTVTTPRGGQYKVTLSDGTLVWLNAASSISFPAAFTGGSRAVSITGEAYFEVAHNKQKPFLVSAGGQTIEVLGTHFNVNAYTDEPGIRTTLLEGSVKIRKGGNNVLIKPGQQALLAYNTNNFSVSHANLEKAIAWTNGSFVFDRDNIQAIMRQISRWYNVDIIYEGATAHKDFVGSVSRFDNVAEVLNTLQLTGTVHFRIEGRRIAVIAN